MPINKGDIPFIGTRDGICGYWRHGINIIRKSTPLTSGRVKKDPVFRGFRKSSNRMKEASPIAAALYNQIPIKQKKFNLYRILTGEALKMIKEGRGKAEIIRQLQQQYIDPIIRVPVRRIRRIVKSELAQGSYRKILFTIKEPTELYQVRIPFRTGRYWNRIKSTLSPPFSGLNVDLTAYQ